MQNHDITEYASEDIVISFVDILILSYSVNEANRDPQEIFRPLDSVIALRPLSYSGLGDNSSVDPHDISDRPNEINSCTTHSTTNLGVLGSLWTRAHGRSRLQHHIKSSKRHSAAELEPARTGRGIWKDQLLIDRTLRGMAALMVAFAIAMIIVIAVYSKELTNRANNNTSTSVGGKIMSCNKVVKTNTILLLLINVCATMVLGISNTYQQLVTSLQKSDLKHMLSEFGDARVGTNSPLNIKYKRKGKKRAWAAWTLMISTSMPVHLLANSLIGISYSRQMPSNVSFEEVEGDLFKQSYIGQVAAAYGIVGAGEAFLCWSTFITGVPHMPRRAENVKEAGRAWNLDSSPNDFSREYKTMRIKYNSSCTEYLKISPDEDLTDLENMLFLERRYSTASDTKCWVGRGMHCWLEHLEATECSLNVRMSAAFILMICFVIKATYMVSVNLVNRGKLKTQLLVFGDVVVTSASNMRLRVHGLSLRFP